jgi:hypothetical protein
MPTSSRLTQAQRQEIARERAKGVPAQALAARFGVSRQTIHSAARRIEGAAARGAASRVLSLRVSDRDLGTFDAALVRLGVGRSEAMKRMMGRVGGLLAADDEAAAALRELGAQINRLGSNINQIARACNEARMMGQPLPYTEASHAEVRTALRLVFQVARQAQAIAEARCAQFDHATLAAFREPSDAAP